MDGAALLGLVGLLLVKEAGLPIPIPGDLLVLGAGVAAAGAASAGAAVPAPVVLGGILAAGFVGGTIQFLLVRGALRGPLIALLGRLGLSRERLDGLADWLRRRGVRGVTIARATPGLRVGAISASGLAALPYPVFLAGLIVGNTVFVGAHFALGYVVGPPAVALIASAGGLAVAVVAFVGLALLGAAGWRILRRRRLVGATSRGGEVGAVGVTGAARFETGGLGSWAEAACPACLAVTIVSARANADLAR
jgi:membrane protein DedA with SNARE-associated domain